MLKKLNVKKIKFVGNLKCFGEKVGLNPVLKTCLEIERFFTVQVLIIKVLLLMPTK